MAITSYSRCGLEGRVYEIGLYNIHNRRKLASEFPCNGGGGNRSVYPEQRRPRGCECGDGDVHWGFWVVNSSPTDTG